MLVYMCAYPTEIPLTTTSSWSFVQGKVWALCMTIDALHIHIYILIVNFLISCRHDGLIIMATNCPFDLDEGMHRRITIALELH